MIDYLMEYEDITLVACNEQYKLLRDLTQLGINITAIDYDEKFKGMNSYVCADFVFDDVTFGECVVHYNCEKTYPLGKIYKGDMILIGDDQGHNGDPNPITSHEQLIEQNNITEVYETDTWTKRGVTHYLVWGTNK